MNRNGFCLLVSFLFFLAFSATLPALADEQPIATLAPVVVTAPYQPIPSSPASSLTTVISRDQIERSPARDLPQLLRQQVGVHVSDTSGTGRGATVDIRGFGETGAQNTLVLIDGRRMTQIDSGSNDWAQIPLERVERVEIVRGGSGSVLYGDNASGGVIHITTRSGTANPQRSVAISAGSYGAMKTAASASGALDNLAYRIDAGYNGIDGYRDNSQTHANDAALTLDHFVTDQLTLHYRAGHHHDRSGMPGALTERDLASGWSRQSSRRPNDFFHADEHYLQVEPELRIDPQQQLQVTLSLQERDTFYSVPGWQQRRHSHSWSMTPQWSLTAPLAGHANQLHFGVDQQLAQGDLADSFMGGSTLERNSWAVYVKDSLAVTERWHIGAGYRRQLTEVIRGGTSALHDRFDNTAWSIETGYDYQPHSTLYASIAASFRTPTFDEFSWSEALRPQRSVDYTVGLRHRFSDTLRLNLDLYQMDVQQELFYDPSGGPWASGINRNFDGATQRRGLEGRLVHDWSTVTLGATLGYVEARIRDGIYSGHRLPAVPRVTATV
ncbi:MAG: TonB-dependent receptor, partial [Magnetococcales bacterium]|nr:TonB-dependent receptor [Magnetococcales bacterium]